MKLKSFLAVTALTLATALPATAMAETCKVTDPTNTPLNARATPNGKIIGKVKNGTVVYTTEYATDSKGRGWTLVFNAKNNKYIGWVYREFVSCY